MESNLERLGNYIKEVDIRNRDMNINKLIGVSIEKQFMDSVANIIGTDLSNYKVINRFQFACSLMQVSRDGGVAVSLYKGEKPSIMSPAYYIFEIVGDKLLPEYLELILTSSEFDREAVFMAVGGVRGTLTWEDFCDLKINVPDIMAQEKIIREINSLSKRITTLKKECNKFEELIDCVFHRYFDKIDKNKLLSSEIDPILGGTPSTDVPDYWNGDVCWINSGEINSFRITKPTTYITEKGLKNSAAKLMKKHTVVIAITGVTLGQESILLVDSSGNQSVIGIPETNSYPYEYLHPLIKDSLFELLKNQTGGAQPHINKDDVKAIPIHSFDSSLMEEYRDKVKNLYLLIEKKCFEIDKIVELKGIMVNSL